MTGNVTAENAGANAGEKKPEKPVKVVATGTFDILHQGHIYYLTESKKLGDELHVIVARDANVRHKPKPVVPEHQRVFMVGALKTVDYAHLGNIGDLFKPIKEIDPDIITIGFNQFFDLDKLRDDLKKRGLRAKVVKIGAFEGNGFSSSREIMHNILKERCPKFMESGENDGSVSEGSGGVKSSDAKSD